MWPRPIWTAAHTVFGKVLKGQDVVNSIVRDKIKDIRILDKNAAAAVLKAEATRSSPVEQGPGRRQITRKLPAA